VRRTLAAGKGSGVRHLLNLTATDGKLVADPEDDKLWLSLESKHTLLEFDFARTWQQELHVMEGAVKRIQQAWRSRTGHQHAAAGMTGARAVSPAGSSRSGLLSNAGSMLVDPWAEADGRSSAAPRPTDSSSCSTNLQAGSSNMLTASSYTGDSCTSYTLYSSDQSGYPSLLSGGASLQSQSALSFAQPSHMALGLPAASSTDLSYTSGVTEGSSSMLYSNAAVVSAGYPAAVAAGVGASAGSTPTQQLGQQGAAMQQGSSTGGGLIGSSTGGLGHEQQQRHQALDLAAGLTGFKAGGLIPSSSDPTPRLVRKADV
jgi:hypothetical protein